MASAHQVQWELGDHVVHFYEQEAELVDTVAEFLSAALKAGDAALLVATAGHCAEIDSALKRLGADPDLARHDGRLIVADAGATAARIMRTDLPDPRMFRDVIGGLVQRAGAGGRSVRVYGEMVAVLWEAGLVAAAMELEELWNELSASQPFTLLCGYSADLVAQAGDLGPVSRVCELHSDVLSAGRSLSQASQHFRPYPLAPRAARAFVTDRLRAWGREELVESAAVVVSELATNALTHGRSGFEVQLVRHLDIVRMSVSDDSRDVPAAVPAGGHWLTGRGLTIVEALAVGWGHEVSPSGKRIWADLRSS